MRIFLIFLLSLLVISCGGGSGAPTPQSPSTSANVDARGLYNGQSSSGAQFTALITSDKIYAVTFDPNNPSIPADIGVGGYSVSGNTLTANELVYFNYNDGFGTVDVNATVSERSSFNGSITLNGSQVSFTSSYDSSYNLNASIDEINGRSTGLTASQNYGYESAILNVSENGEFSGLSYSGCQATGTFTASQDGNFYNNQVSVSNCGNLSGQPLSGVSLYVEDTNILYTIAVNNNQTGGFIYWGDVVRAISTESISNAPRGALSSQSNAEGLWEGSTQDGRTLIGLITDEGESYMLYSARNSGALAGIAYGYLRNTSNGFESIYARDFNLEGYGILDLDVSGVINSESSGISGTLDYDGSLNAFSLAYNNLYESTPNIQGVAGTYNGISFISAGSESAQVTIDTNGLFTGVGSSGCQVQGVISPRVRGNFYDMTVTFRNSSCLYTNQLFSGVLIYDGVDKIYSAAPSPDLTDGVLFIGTKQ